MYLKIIESNLLLLYYTITIILKLINLKSFHNFGAVCTNWVNVILERGLDERGEGEGEGGEGEKSFIDSDRRTDQIVKRN